MIRLASKRENGELPQAFELLENLDTKE